MANRFNEIVRLAQETFDRVSSSPGDWVDYLKTAARNYAGADSAEDVNTYPILMAIVVYTMIMHCLFNTINVLLSYLRLGEIPTVAVVGVFIIAIIGFVILIILFFIKNTIDTNISRSEGRYKPWKLITKEGYITMAVCITVMEMLIMM